jgi:hypothetical protein
MCLHGLQVRALSKLPADRIEAAAAVPEPLQNADGSGIVKLWGEDALLDWPGAMGPGGFFLLSVGRCMLPLIIDGAGIAKLRGEVVLLQAGRHGPDGKFCSSQPMFPDLSQSLS